MSAAALEVRLRAARNTKMQEYAGEDVHADALGRSFVDRAGALPRLELDEDSVQALLPAGIEAREHAAADCALHGRMDEAATLGAKAALPRHCQAGAPSRGRP